MERAGQPVSWLGPAELAEVVLTDPVALVEYLAEASGRDMSELDSEHWFPNAVDAATALLAAFGSITTEA